VRDAKRIPKILKALGEYWKEHPDLRLGQMVFYFTHRTSFDPNVMPDIFYVEDDDILAALEREKKE